MMKYLLLSIFCLCPLFIDAQGYDDVAVVMNINNPESILVGEYFQDKNNIPQENMIYVEMPLTEEIDTSQANAILQAIKTQLEANTQSDQINYIVTTLGCPQLVTPYSFADPTINQRGFEIMVALLSIDIAQNTYKGESSPFTFLEYGYRIVSRLEAGTLEGTYRMIDRGGPQEVDIKDKVVLDFYAPFTFQDSFVWEIIIDQLIQADESLELLEIDTELDTLEEHYSSDERLLAYSMSGIGNQGVPVSPFVEKTQEIGLLKIARSGVKSNYGNVLTVFDFLEAECHAAAGFYTYFYVSTFAEDEFYKNYFNGDMQMNIGESIFSALNNTSTPITLFGDPKSRVASLSYTSDPENNTNAKIFPVPTRDFVNINFEDRKERSLVFYDSTGKKIFSKSVMDTENHIDISFISPGVFYVLLREDEKIEVRKILKL